MCVSFFFSFCFFLLVLIYFSYSDIRLNLQSCYDILLCSCITSLFVFLGLSLPIKKIQFKKICILGSGTTTLIISNEEMNGIIKIVQALEDSNILLKE